MSGDNMITMHCHRHNEFHPHCAACHHVRYNDEDESLENRNASDDFITNYVSTLPSVEMLSDYAQTSSAMSSSDSISTPDSSSFSSDSGGSSGGGGASGDF